MKKRPIGFFVLFLALVSYAQYSHAQECIPGGPNDMDGDGYCSPGGDCDDSNPTIHPGSTELCDAANVDEDCDPNTFGFRDDDEDSYPDAKCCNMLGGRLICGNDCNDNARHIHPNQSDVCNGIDDNCNGAIDDLPDYLALVFEDTDGDGFGDPGSKMVDCPAPIGSNTGSRPSSLLGNDCDDTNPAIQPGTIVCDASARRKVFVCNSVGVFEPSVCPGGRGMKCVPQPNGTGICQR